MNKFLVFTLFAAVIPMSAAAQELCSPDDALDLEICLEDSRVDCLDSYPGCEEPGEGAPGGDLASAVFDNIAETCCNKGNAGKIGACLNASLAALKRGGKVILPGGIGKQVSAHIKELSEAVKSDGECFADDEDDDDDFDDEF